LGIFSGPMKVVSVLYEFSDAASKTLDGTKGISDIASKVSDATKGISDAATKTLDATKEV